MEHLLCAVPPWGQACRLLPPGQCEVFWKSLVFYIVLVRAWGWQARERRAAEILRLALCFCPRLVQGREDEWDESLRKCHA